MDSPKYAKFEISEVTYKVVNGQKIKAFIMIPKNAFPGKHPVMAKFHGGFFCTGGSLYPDWFPQWALDYCLLHSAIIVTGDYRLIPESNGLDIMEDLSDFWTWVRNELPQHLATCKPEIEADLSRVIAYGESAGGFMALQSGFTQPHGFIKAVIATYPTIDQGAKREKPVMGAPILPITMLQDHLKSMVPGKIVTSAFPPERMHISLSMVQQGRLQEFFGTDESLDLKKVAMKSKDVPFMLILHGRDDTAVPIEGSFEFEEVAKKIFGPDKIMLCVEPGDHGFDGSATLETSWLKEGLSKVTKQWII